MAYGMIGIDRLFNVLDTVSEKIRTEGDYVTKAVEVREKLNEDLRKMHTDDHEAAQQLEDLKTIMPREIAIIASAMDALPELIEIAKEEPTYARELLFSAYKYAIHAGDWDDSGILEEIVNLKDNDAIIKPHRPKIDLNQFVSLYINICYPNMRPLVPSIHTVKHTWDKVMGSAEE